MILDACRGHAAGEVNQGLSLRIFPVRLGQSFNSREAAVRVEDVELHVIRDKHVLGRARVPQVLGRSVAGLGGVDLLQRLDQDVPIVREILNQLKRRAVGGYGDEIVRRALLQDEVFRGGHRTNEILCRERGQVKEQEDQALVLQLFFFLLGPRGSAEIHDGCLGPFFLGDIFG